jgi:DNA helicase TIP49 (TBP-interacting protein)
MLDIEAFSFLNRALEQEFAPLLVLATNRAVTKVRGTDYRPPHGIPIDMPDRLLIAKTKIPPPEDVKKIIEIKAVADGVELSAEALDLLTGDRGEEELALRRSAVATSKGRGRDIREQHCKARACEEGHECVLGLQGLDKLPQRRAQEGPGALRVPPATQHCKRGVLSIAREPEDLI